MHNVHTLRLLLPIYDLQWMITDLETLPAVAARQEGTTEDCSDSLGLTLCFESVPVFLRAIILVLARRSPGPSQFEPGLVRLPLSAIVFPRLVLGLESDEELLKNAAGAAFLDMGENLWFWA
jgi:hypothetical protein